MKKLFLYLLTVSMFFNTFVITYAKDAKPQQIEEIFEYIVPMEDNRTVDIDYEAELIIATQRYYTDSHSSERIFEGRCAVFDFDGNIIVDYDSYDYISFICRGEYIAAVKGEETLYFDKSGKKANLQGYDKVYGLPYSHTGYVLENKHHFKIVNRNANTEIKISKKDLLSSDSTDLDKVDFIEISQITEDFIVFDTKLNTVVFSKDGKLRYRFAKSKYRNSGEIEYSFDNPQLPLEFNCNGYAGYRSDNRLCGVVDTYGNVVINPEFKYLLMDSEDTVLARKSGGKWGIMGVDKKIAIDFKYDSINKITDDIYLVESNRDSQFINLKTSDVLSITNGIDPDGMAFFQFQGEQLAVLKKEGKYGVISLIDGKEILSFEYDYIGNEFTDGMILVGVSDADYGMRYGFADTKGELKIPLIYSETAGFSEGLCGVIYREYDKKGYITKSYSAFIDKNNKKIISLDKDIWVYRDSKFSEGLAPVRCGDPMFGYCVYIDKTGKTIISDSAWSNSVGSFKNRLATVSNYIAGGPSNWYSTSGVIKFLGDTAAADREAARISAGIGDTSKNWRYIVPFGKYDHCEILSNGLIKIGTTIDWFDWSDGNAPPDPVMIYGLLDAKGKRLTGMTYNYISEPNEDSYMLAEVKKGGKKDYVLFDGKGKIIPTRKNATVKLFSRSYCVETENAITCYVNGKSYRVLKNVLKKSGILFGGETDHEVIAVYGNCFILQQINDAKNITTFVLNFDGTVRYKTERYVIDTPHGMIIQNENNPDQSFIDFDGKELLASAHGRRIDKLYNSATNGAVPGVYIFNGGILDANRSGEFEAFRWSIPGNANITGCDTQNKILYLEKEGKLGLYSFTGKVILPCEYDDIGKMSEGLIRFQKGNKFGFANINGEILFESDYILRWDFSEGLAGYQIQEGGYGYLNADFEPVIKFDEGWTLSHDEGEFKNGLAAVQYNGEVLYIDCNGKIIIAGEKGQIPWEYTYRNKNGLIAVSSHAPFANQHRGPIMYDYDGVIEYIR